MRLELVPGTSGFSEVELTTVVVKEQLCKRKVLSVGVCQDKQILYPPAAWTRNQVGWNLHVIRQDYN